MQFDVNHGGVDGIYAELSRRTNEIRSLLSDLERVSEATLASWDGTARDAYARAKVEWNSAANAMAAMIANRSTTLNNINQNYQAQDRSAAGLFG
jgi:WXG100 family type VII secretion target